MPSVPPSQHRVRYWEGGGSCTHSQGRGYVLYTPLGNVGCSVHTVREEDMFCTHLWGMWDVLYIQLGKRICSVHTFGECGMFCTYS